MTSVPAIPTPRLAVSLFAAALALLSVGLVTVYSASGYTDHLVHHDPFFHVKRQAVWIALGLVGLFVTSRMDYQRLTHFAKPLLWFSLFLLILCYVPGIGKNVKGQSRWIGAGGFTFQPSELAKLAMVLYMAKTLAEKRNLLTSFTMGFLPAAFITGIFLVTIVLEQDLGATFVLGLIVWLMWYVAGMRVTHLVSLVVAAAPALLFFVLSEAWRVKRLIAFLNPEDHRLGVGMQLDQSLIAIGTGGVTGRGLGHGLQKHLYLTEVHTDFIFANLCEELGLLGGVAIIVLFAALVIMGTVTALRMPDFFGSLLACGVTLMIGVPSLVNLAVVMGLMPTKGLPLPFISYGGSQILVNMSALGILMNLALHRERVKGGRRARRT